MACLDAYKAHDSQPLRLAEDIRHHVIRLNNSPGQTLAASIWVSGLRWTLSANGAWKNFPNLRAMKSTMCQNYQSHCSNTFGRFFSISGISKMTSSGCWSSLPAGSGPFLSLPPPNPNIGEKGRKFEAFVPLMLRPSSPWPVVLIGVQPSQWCKGQK